VYDELPWGDLLRPLLMSGAVLSVLAFMPSLIAWWRRHPHALTVVALNGVSVVMIIGMTAVLVLEYGSDLLAGRALGEIGLILLGGCLPWVITLCWSCGPVPSRRHSP
jgi:hypothetical protein